MSTQVFTDDEGLGPEESQRQKAAERALEQTRKRREEESRRNEEYHSAANEARSRGVAVTKVQEERWLTSLVNRIGGRNLDRVTKAREEAEAKAREAEALERAHQAAIASWDQMLKAHEELHAVLARGDAQKVEIENLITELRQTLYSGRRHWGVSHLKVQLETWTRGAGIGQVYSQILGLEAALEDYPNWRKPVEQQLIASRKSIKDFAVEHEVPKDVWPSDVK